MTPRSQPYLPPLPPQKNPKKKGKISPGTHSQHLSFHIIIQLSSTLTSCPAPTTLLYNNRSLDPRKVEVEESEEEENDKWRRLMTILVALALYLLTAVLMQQTLQLNRQVA